MHQCIDYLIGFGQGDYVSNSSILTEKGLRKEEIARIIAHIFCEQM